MEFNIYKEKFEAELRQSLIKQSKAYILPPEDTNDKEDTMSLESLDLWEFFKICYLLTCL